MRGSLWYVGTIQAFTLAVILPCAALAADPALHARKLLERETGSLKLPAGAILLRNEIVLPTSAHDLDIDAHGVTLQFAPDFEGRAGIVISGGKNIRISGLAIDGKRAPATHAGILAEKVEGLELDGLQLRNIGGFPIVISASSQVKINSVTIDDSGGGILIEEGTRDFSIAGCVLQHVLGVGIWTRSLSQSPRNTEGQITGNRLSEIGRDAIRIGNSTRVSVSKNVGARIGYPANADATPAALASTGNTDVTRFTDNAFQEVNGKCLGLDGFHDGELRANSCINHADRAEYPQGGYAIALTNSSNVLIWSNRVEGFLYGGLLLSGSGHRIAHNHFLRLNLAHVLPDGIQLRGEARDNTIEDNEISGFGLGARCVTFAPGVQANQNRIARNSCSDDAPVNASLR